MTSPPLPPARPGPAGPAWELNAELLLRQGPEGADPDQWAVELLRSAQRTQTDLAERSAGAVLSQPVTPRSRAWAELVRARTVRPVDHQLLLSRTSDLMNAGDPATAMLGLARAGGRARGSGFRAAGELIHLGRLAVIDRADGAPPLTTTGHPAHKTGLQPGGTAVAAAWPLFCAGSTAALADHLDLAAGDDELTGGIDTVIEALHLVARALRLAPAPAAAPAAAPDIDWLRGGAVRGLAFAVAATGEARFAEYDRYVRERAVGPTSHVEFLERWTQALTLTGELAAAQAVLDRAARLTDESDPEHLPARLQFHRGRARLWRIAGDPRRGLIDSDRAVDIIANAPWPPVPAARGNVWLNRSAVLLELGRNDEAYAAAVEAEASYAEDSGLNLGLAEARQLQCSSDPDPDRGRAVARQLLSQYKAGRLPHPIRAATLLRIAQRLADTDPAQAWAVYQEAATHGLPGRRVTVLIALQGARFLLDHAGPGVPGDALLTWARRAVTAADYQGNGLLGAQTRLLLARCLSATTDGAAEAAEVGRRGLEQLLLTLTGLTADGGEHLLEQLRDDLAALFDTAVLLQDGDLALRTVEAGRAIRLAATIRLDPTALPDEVRTALAEVTAALRAEQGAGEQPDTETPGEEVRAMRMRASQAAALSRQTVDELCGSVVRDITIDADLDPTSLRASFPRTHLLSLSERDGVLRWVWWPPDRQSPLCGRRALSGRARRLLADYASGAIRTETPGDITAGLSELLPEDLRRLLADTRQVVDLLVSPSGRVWHVPLLSVPLGVTDSGSTRRLLHAARMTLAPSLRYAQLLAARDLDRQGPTDIPPGTVFYCNPTLKGAQIEQATLTRHLNGHPLSDIRLIGTPTAATLGVIATHADAAPGLNQRLYDHAGNSLTAGECLLRDFPSTVVLGSCHGYGSADLKANPEPIGLVTVISARGATWTIGGHQEVTDETSAWILSRVYKDLAGGVPLDDALREAQLAYLAHVGDGGPRLPPPDDFPQLPYGSTDWSAPWQWALTIVGPPVGRGGHPGPHGETATGPAQPGRH